MSIREKLAEEYPDVDLLFMDEAEYDAAILGVSQMCFGSENHFRVIYDWDKVIDINVEMFDDDDDEEDPYTEAIAHFDYNQGGAYMGEHTPIYIRRTNNIIGETE